jgi:uncharacterized protein
LSEIIARQIAQKILALAQKFPVVTITGPWQSGKSPLVKALFAEKPYVSFEDPDVRLLAQTDPRAFLSNFPEGAIFDEIQRVPDLFSYIQSIVDAHNIPGMFIFSGSQNFLLMESVSQSLAGRVAILKLLPFSLQERRKFRSATESVDELLWTGAYPRLFDQHILPTDFYPNYVQTYLERDVKTLRNIGDLSTFTRFLKLCAGRIGTVLNYSSLASDCAVSVNTIKAWVSVLEASYVVYLLPPYYRNFNKRLIKSPKVYFYDTGLACSLLNIQSPNQLNTHYLRGNLFENWAISEILKHFFNQGQLPPCYYWQDQSGKEIDFLLEMPQSLKVLEVNAGMGFTNEYFKNLTYFEKIAEKTLPLQKYVLYTGERSFQTSLGKYVTPATLTEVLL